MAIVPDPCDATDLAAKRPQRLRDPVSASPSSNGRGHGTAAFVLWSSRRHRGAPDAPCAPNPSERIGASATSACSCFAAASATRPVLLLRYSGDPGGSRRCSCAGSTTSGAGRRRRSRLVVAQSGVVDEQNRLDGVRGRPGRARTAHGSSHGVCAPPDAGRTARYGILCKV